MERQLSLPINLSAASNSVNQCFEEAIHLYRHKIYRFLLASVRDQDLAESLTQETFLKAFRNWSGFRGNSHVSTWLMRIAINLQKDHWRSRRMQFWSRTRANSLDTEEALQHVAVSSESPERLFAAREQLNLVWKAVSKLTEAQRTVFLLRVVEELKLAEVAEVTDMPESTVKAHFYRATAKIRAMLEEWRCRQVSASLSSGA